MSRQLPSGFIIDADTRKRGEDRAVRLNLLVWLIVIAALESGCLLLPRLGVPQIVMGILWTGGVFGIGFALALIMRPTDGSDTGKPD